LPEGAEFIDALFNWVGDLLEGRGEGRICLRGKAKILLERAFQEGGKKKTQPKAFEYYSDRRTGHSISNGRRGKGKKDPRARGVQCIG